MSTRTIIEINHDHLTLHTASQLTYMLTALISSKVTGMLNENDGKPVDWSTGIRILGQRHHSETLKLEVK